MVRGGTLLARIEPVAGYDTSATAAVETLAFSGPLWDIRIDTAATALVRREDSGTEDFVVFGARAPPGDTAACYT